MRCPIFVASIEQCAHAQHVSCTYGCFGLSHYLDSTWSVSCEEIACRCVTCLTNMRGGKNVLGNPHFAILRAGM